MNTHPEVRRQGTLITRFPLECGWGGEEKLHADLADGCKQKGMPAYFWTSDTAFLKGLRERKAHARRAFFVKDVTSFISLLFAPISIFFLVAEACFFLPYFRMRGCRNIYMLTFIEKVILSPIALLLGYRLFWAHHAPLGNWFFCNPFLLLWRIWSQWATIVVPSMHMKKSFRGSVNDQKIRVIPNPIPRQKIRSGNGEFLSRHQIQKQGCVIGTAGRLSAEKNLKAFIGFAKYFKEHTFLIAGAGKQRNELESLIRDCGLTNCFLLGRLSGDELWDFYCDLDIFCLLSAEESFGLAAGEASSIGISVIASARSGTAEVIADRRTGLLFDPLKPDDARLKLATLIRSPQLRARLGASGRIRMQEFTEEIYLDRMTELLTQGKKV